jgi:hypothetical protein
MTEETHKTIAQKKKDNYMLWFGVIGSFIFIKLFGLYALFWIILGVLLVQYFPKWFK